MSLPGRLVSGASGIIGGDDCEDKGRDDGKESLAREKENEGKKGKYDEEDEAASASDGGGVLDFAVEDCFTRYRAGYAVAYAKRHKSAKEASSPEAYRRAFVGRMERMVKCAEDMVGDAEGGGVGGGSGGGGGGGGGGLLKRSKSTVARSEKVYDGSESIDELLTDSMALVKDDFPMLAVLALRRARAQEKDAQEGAAGSSSGDGSSGGGDSGASFGAGGNVDDDPRAAAALACESELVALLEDMAEPHRWTLHGKGRAGATVSVEKKDFAAAPSGGASSSEEEKQRSSRLLRFKCEQVISWNYLMDDD